MATFQYSPLENPKSDIRLLELLPGSFDDDIHVKIHISSLVQPEATVVQRSSLSELKSTLPEHWHVLETIEGRYIFDFLDEKTQLSTSSWTHPDTNIQETLYNAWHDGRFPNLTPKYEALSYTWGSADNPQTIWVEPSTTIPVSNTQHGLRSLKIQMSLTSALRYLRHSNISRHLWVDAICINQNDILERNEQVSRMGDVYQFAERVVVWLGPESADSSSALSTLGHLGDQIEYTKQGIRLCAPQCQHPDWYVSETDLPYDQSTWQAVSNLLSRSWFERLWVTQEIQLANSHALVVCGHDFVLWSRFRRGLIAIGDKRNLPLPELQAKRNLIRSLGRPLTGKPIHALLNICHTRKCSDPRDKIYGILGLAPPGLTLRPNYSASVAEVYREVRMNLIRESRRIGFLHCSYDQIWPTMPSWVPDWTMITDANASPSFCSGNSSVHAVVQSNILQVKGIHCATVCSTSPPLIIQNSDEATWSRFRDWALKNVQATSYPSGGSPIRALAISTLSGMVKDRYTSQGFFPQADLWTEQFQEYLSNPQSSVPSSIVKALAMVIQHNETIFTTKEGYIGSTLTPLEPGK